MEIHAHSHIADPALHRGRKKWKHYFWEFLMLFLAVFCGFLAEYQLEHKIERDREKQYMGSLLVDLRSDTSHINGVMNLFSLNVKMEDSLKAALLRPGVINDGSIAYRYLGYPLTGSVFQRSEGTINQLKNAGGWRLLHSTEVINRLNAYDEAYRRSEVVNQLIREHYFQYTDIYFKVANSDLVEVPFSKPILIKPGTVYKWNTNDPQELKSLYNAVSQLQYVANMYVLILKGLHQKALDLILYLEKKRF
ncbi:MAG TPA: hypothetical protein VFP97_01215 [Chitinophagaceae bacterium]|nr:hypothetical protein [Chitinophagaceae bacterium]